VIINPFLWRCHVKWLRIIESFVNTYLNPIWQCSDIILGIYKCTCTHIKCRPWYYFTCCLSMAYFSLFYPKFTYLLMFWKTVATQNFDSVPWYVLFSKRMYNVLESRIKLYADRCWNVLFTFFCLWWRTPHPYVHILPSIITYVHASLLTVPIIAQWEFHIFLLLKFSACFFFTCLYRSTTGVLKIYLHIPMFTVVECIIWNNWQLKHSSSTASVTHSWCEQSS